MSVSVVFETRNFIHDGGYPPMDDHPDGSSDVDRFTDPTDSVVNDLAPVATYNAPTTPFVTADTSRLDLSAAVIPIISKEDSPIASSTPMRNKTILKPEREITKNSEGKFVCTYPDCTDDIKEWTRKCEWNKHMDKHDRPYKCQAPGCEKLAGFTYSGGLLRHEREVHGKHGGPKNSLNCPHPHCKRYNGKGFSRVENLNEHLRRVHTGQAGASSAAEGDTDDAVSVASAGQKRKRGADDGAEMLREEVKRLRAENGELRRQVENQNRQTTGFLQQIQVLNQQLAAQSEAQSLL